MMGRVLKEKAGVMTWGADLVSQGGEMVYGGIVSLVRAQFESGWRRRFRLPCRVISIGNITTGGTGKTPLVQTVAEHLRQAGLRVVVLCRGYRGGLSKAGAVVSDGSGALISWEACGDEPFLHAARLRGIPVIIGRDRVKAGLRAVKDFGASVVILDDGFQYWRLHRDMDIVTINATDPFGGGRLLPTGRLREPLTALRRAHVVVLTKTGQISGEELAGLSAAIQKRVSLGTPLFFADYRAAGFSRYGEEHQQKPPDWLTGKEVVAACALADGKGFVATLRKLGCIVRCSFLFPDHHRFTDSDCRQIITTARKSGAAVIISEKDAVKWSFNDPATEIWVLRVEMQVRDEERFFALLRDSVWEARRRQGMV